MGHGTSSATSRDQTMHGGALPSHRGDRADPIKVLLGEVSQNLQKLTNPLGGGGGGSSAFTKASTMVQDRLESKQHIFSYEDSEPDVDDVEDDTFLDSKIIKLSAEYGINEGTRTERLAMFKQNPSAAIKQIKPLWPYGTAPPPLPSEHPVWWSEILPSQRVPPRRRIFCNRSLNMRNMKAIGFDMDYTLAQYKVAEFEGLTYKLAMGKLVEKFGYPSAALHGLTLDPTYMIKGLVIDKKRGNMIKADRFHYVKVAYHGFKELSSEQRKILYNAAEDRDFVEPDYGNLDTSFSIAECYLFMQLVELKDNGDLGPKGSSRSYAEIYSDLRNSINMCHLDGSLKKVITANPARFLYPDPLMPQVLKALRAAGKKVFLATNSLWDFTNVIMNFLLLGKTGHEKTFEWLAYFDVVMVGCGKPGFFGPKGQLFQVDLSTGLLRNLDNGAPTVPLEEPDSPRPAAHDLKKSMSAPGLTAMDQKALCGPARPADVYQGGCYKDLHRMLDIKCGSEVLYAGDHILGDVLKSKKNVGWRTLLLVPELDVDISLQEASDLVFHELAAIRAQREAVDDEIQRLETSLFIARELEEDAAAARGSTSAVPASSVVGVSSTNSKAMTTLMIEQLHSPKARLEMIERLKYKREGLQRRHSTLLGELHQRYHPVWGMLFKTGSVTSRFAEQCEKYGCIYTTHISNLAFYSPNKSYKGRDEHLAHEWLEEIS